MAVYCFICSVIRVVGLATRYGLDGPGIESRWRRDFPHPFRPALKPTHPPIEWVPGLSRELSGRGVALTTHPHLTLWLKKEETIPLLPLWALMACSRVNFTVIGTFGLLKYKYPNLVCQYWPKFTAGSLAVCLRCWRCMHSATEVLLFFSHSSTEVSACNYQPQTMQYCKPVRWRHSYGAYITYLWAVLPTSVYISYSFMHLEIPFIISLQTREDCGL